jgi:hypothetical protein
MVRLLQTQRTFENIVLFLRRGALQKGPLRPGRFYAGTIRTDPITALFGIYR